MDLEELKVAWDSENQEPLFTLPAADLHGIVQRRLHESERAAAYRYRIEIFISVACGALMAVLAGSFVLGRTQWLAAAHWPKVTPTAGDIAALAVAGGIWFYFAAYLDRARRRLQRCGETFDSSLRGDIERALARVDFQTRIARGLVWRGILPAFVAVALWVIVLLRLSAGPAWSGMFAAMVVAAAFAMELSRLRRTIDVQYEPQRRELESLRRKLADPWL